MQAELVASADARGAVGVLRRAQEDASAKEESLQGELERCRAELADALATQDRAEQKLNEREQYVLTVALLHKALSWMRM